MRFKEGAVAKTAEGVVGAVKGHSANMVSLTFAEIEPGVAGRNVPGRNTESKWAAAHKQYRGGAGGCWRVDPRARRS